MLLSENQTDFRPLFEAVGCVCLWREKILLLKRVNDRSYPECWGIPSGKLQPDEPFVRAIVRELFEETSILLSSANLKLVKRYCIARKEMSFVYTVYLCRLIEVPPIVISPKEHTRFDWFTLDDALRLELVPDLDGCLRDIFPSLIPDQQQLDLFTGRPSLVLTLRKAWMNGPATYPPHLST